MIITPLNDVRRDFLCLNKQKELKIAQTANKSNLVPKEQNLVSVMCKILPPDLLHKIKSCNLSFKSMVLCLF